MVVGLVVLLVGAGFAGALVNTTGVSAGGATVSASTLRSELAVIATHPAFDCYLGPSLASSEINVEVTATPAQIDAGTAAQWAALQVKGLAVEQYVKEHYGWHVTAAQLAAAQTSYASDLSNLAANDEVSCPTSASAAVAALPAWFRNGQLAQDAASQVFTEHVKGTVPLTKAGLEKVYDADPAAYDTICLALVEVPDGARKAAFLNASEHGHESVAQLAKTYSIDSSAKSGGTLGCYAPSSGDYSAAAGYTKGVALNHFPTTPQVDSQGDSYFLTATARTPNSFAAVESVILQEALSANANLASEEQTALLQTESVTVSPEFGRWTPSLGSVRVLLRPSRADTPNGGAGLPL